MIVVVGSPTGRLADDRVRAAGSASRVALAAAATGHPVQLVGRVGDDPIADAVVLDLARGGVGHVALLRDPARATPLDATPGEADGLEPGETGGVVGVGDTLGASLAPSLEAADVDLGLRYLTDFGVVVVTGPVGPDVLAVVADAARWAEARLVLVVRPGTPLAADLPPDVVVFEAPDDDPDGVFATLVGTFASALDDGIDAADAFRASIESDGWTEAEPA